MNDKQSPTTNNKVSAELILQKTINALGGSHVKTFLAIYLTNDCLWICGWNVTIIGKRNFVLLYAKPPKYHGELTKKIKDKKPNLSTSMFPLGNNIIFVKRGQSKLEYFNLQTKTISNITEFDKASFLAVCGSDKFMYSLDNKYPNMIKIWDPTFQCCGKISLDFEYVDDSEIDMCFLSDSDTHSHLSDSPNDNANIDHIIVITASCPHASVRAVSQMRERWFGDWIAVIVKTLTFSLTHAVYRCLEQETCS